jgi:LysR family transcriptional regulator, cell division regulator
MIPSPADLSYFVEIAGTLNLSLAAERLGISQPSLSLAVRRMEAAVGTPLFIRSRKGVALTQAGRQLLAHSRHLLQTWEGVRAEALASMNEVQGSYTIGCHPSVGLYALSGFLPSLMEKHPGLNISLKHDLSRRIAEEVISMRIDVGIVVNPVRHPDLVIQPLTRDEVTLWTGEGKNKVQDIGAGDAVLICDPDLAQSQALMKKFDKSGLKFGRIVVSGNLEVVADLAAHGCGIGILPSKVARVARKALRRIPRAPVFYDELCLVFRVENRGVKSIQAVNQAIKTFFGRESDSR